MTLVLNGWQAVVLLQDRLGVKRKFVLWDSQVAFRRILHRVSLTALYLFAEHCRVMSWL